MTKWNAGALRWSAKRLIIGSKLGLTINQRNIMNREVDNFIQAQQTWSIGNQIYCSSWTGCLSIPILALGVKHITVTLHSSFRSAAEHFEIGRMLNKDHISARSPKPQLDKQMLLAVYSNSLPSTVYDAVKPNGNSSSTGQRGP